MKRVMSLGQNGGSETILLVEDEPALRTLTREFVQGRGYHILPAPNGAEALSISRQHPGPIHLPITDVVLPGISGRELANQLEPLRPDLKVLFVSGYTDDKIAHHGVLEDGIAFLQKPYCPADLLRKVRGFLDKAMAA